MLFKKFNIPAHIRFLFTMYLWGLLFFTGFRVLLLILNLTAGVLPPSVSLLLPQAFFLGFRFDTSILCYILTIPFLILSIGFLVRPLRRSSFYLSYYLLLFFFFISFFICSADIPFYFQFSSRLTTASLLWAETPAFVISMILGTFSYWIFLVLFILVSYRFYKVSIPAKNNLLDGLIKPAKLFSAKPLLYFVLLAPFLFLGIRGRIAQKSPMLTGTAYFCNNNFLNQLGLNPVFTFMTTVIEDQLPENQRLNLMDDAEAIRNVKGYLGSGQDSTSPIARNIKALGEENNMNIVLVIMEGMSSFNMGKYGGRDTITPVLTNLSKTAISFENIFSSGIHTYNGIYSSLFSYPALLGKHSMHDIPAAKYYSMPLVLKEQGYETRFFITHDGQFDNAQGFLTANGFDRVYSEQDYPAEKVLSTLGVPDDYLFDFSIPKLNEIAVQGKNFFAGFMTGSNHYPIIIPDWINHEFSSGEEHIRIIQYSDWAIGEFLKNCAKQSWYNNTIFVFVADHGANWLHTYDMPLGFHHVPLIIHAPGLNLPTAKYEEVGGQIDIFPTLMGLMNKSYQNKTMGLDLLKEHRPYIYFTADNKIGCLDREFYFIHREEGGETLYRYANLDAENLLKKFPAKADSMRAYAFSMLQTAQWIVEREKFAK